MGGSSSRGGPGPPWVVWEIGATVGLWEPRMLTIEDGKLKWRGDPKLHTFPRQKLGEFVKNIFVDWSSMSLASIGSVVESDPPPKYPTWKGIAVTSAEKTLQVYVETDQEKTEIISAILAAKNAAQAGASPGQAGPSGQIQMQ
mmetsp:Transcript_124785/g.388458  ORF Transcript_124785/g.388458 Transcript_124785/m.388458 type:complete len:143 (+) Transcript_124785:64-492(+)|eukprot:CAMPEP_0204567050 /NCGR_PEP_ID=MMETSP0661-20131031/36386_1 /ASSEMBLY_ACC=CAM_ASM_000606 /TAXON_ID=109239 /ORGANISM="Alexandrium margalefi, Strain AMGDE01CS-322" /LENGTH=142 /DNA_ID=CAMNT_0051574937 /DNA_START=64 /DNA_END=492 /DNA_ORIENTATION=+